jgi:hypothetical protein
MTVNLPLPYAQLGMEILKFFNLPNILRFEVLQTEGLGLWYSAAKLGYGSWKDLMKMDVKDLSEMLVNFCQITHVI